MAYKTLVDGLTVPRAVGELTDLFGNVIGHQHQAEVYPRAGTVLDDEDVAPFVQKQVEEGALEGRLEKVGDDARASQEVSEPFPGYSELEVEEVQAAFKVLPSAAIRAIQEYEASEGENRAGIVDYHIGRGEAYTDRLAGRAGSPHQEAEEKDLSQIVSREVEESDVRFGESYQDDGTPLREPGELEGDDRTELAKADDKPRGKRGRRAAAAPAKPSASESKDDGSPS